MDMQSEASLREEAKKRGMDAATTEDFVKSGLEWWNKWGVKAVVSVTEGKSKYSSDR